MTWLLTRGRLPYLALLLAVTAVLGWQAAHLGIESDNRSLDVRHPADEARDRRFAATFGRDDDLLLAASSPRLLEPDGLAALDALVAALGTVPGVGRVFALTTVQTPEPGPAGAELVPLVPRPLDAPETSARLRERLARHPELTGLLVSADRRTAGVLIELLAGPPDAAGDVIERVRALMAARQAPGFALHLTGVPVQKHDVNTYIARDQRLLIPLAIATLAVVLFAFFRRLLGVALPLAVTGLTVIWTLGLYRLAGLELNAITGLLPPVLMVLSLAVGVHLIEAWLVAAPAPPVARVTAALRRVRFPVFFCALTTAFGFGSLLTSTMPAVRSFGGFAALGVALSFVLGMTLVPVLLVRAAPPAGGGGGAHRRLGPLLERLAAVPAAHPGAVLAAFAALTAVAIAGLPRLRNNTDLVRFLKDEAPLYRDTMWVDRHLTGPNPLDFVVSRRDGTPLTRAADVARMAAFADAARRVPHVSDVTSVVGVLAPLEAAEAGGPPRLPETDAETAYLFDLLAAADDPGLLRKLVAPDARSARFNVRVHVVGTAVAAPLADELLATARRIFGPDYRVFATGAFFRVAEDSNALVQAQVRSFGLAMLLVFSSIGLLFRSFALLGVVVVANVTPILWTGGLMGAAGIDVSTGTAMIASSVLGLVVDDTIHYLAGYRRHAGEGVRAAVQHAAREAGPALVVNNLVLAIGFWVGCFGSFKPTIFFSLLSGVTMITAMLCDLLVTPASLVLLDRLRGLRLRRVLAGALLVVLGAGVARAASTTVPPAIAPALVDAGEQRWGRTVVPDEARKVGEVRLVTRGPADVVETILYTTLLPRAVREIGAKERANWPEGRPGHEDAMRYVAALEAASDELGRRLARVAPDEDRRRRLLIEFVLVPGDAAVVLSTYDLDDADEANVRVQHREVLAVLPLSRDYVRRNMRLIAEDSFDAHGASLDRLVSPLRQLAGGAAGTAARVAAPGASR